MSNEEQIAYWNGEAGRRWADRDARMERLLGPITAALLAHCPVPAGSSALDVGCGGGSQTLQLARQLGPSGHVLGIDVSAPLLDVARDKLERPPAGLASVEFLQADAATHPFEANSSDLLFSRFGVMFFEDPLAAFSNMRRALRPAAGLAFCCWQSLRDNAWTWLPLQAALHHISAPPAPDLHAPGPFAFADPERLRDILVASGFDAVRIEPFETSMRFGDATGLAANVRELVSIGPIARLVADLEPASLEPVYASIETALASYYDGEALVLPAAAWFVTATAG